MLWLSVVCVFSYLCVVYFMFDCVGELFVECEVIVFSLKVIWVFLDCVFFGYSMHGLPKSMCAVFVIPVCVQMFPPYVRFVGLYEGCDFRVNSGIEGSHVSCALMLFLCSPK